MSPHFLQNNYDQTRSLWATTLAHVFRLLSASRQAASAKLTRALISPREDLEILKIGICGKPAHRGKDFAVS
jgi:hypothetical protein